MTRREWSLRAAKLFADLDAPRRAAELLLCHVLDIDRLELISRPGLDIEPEQEKTLEDLAGRYLAREPLAYLLGWKEFYGLRFAVNPQTLIPRPESEHLIEEALARLPEHGIRFADLGTGSGCLAITLAKLRPRWRGLALDISEGAVQIAQENAKYHQVDDNLSILVSDFTKPGAWSSDFGALHLIISNPPYVSQAEYEELDPCVRDFEPKGALVPDPTGLQHLEAVIAAAGSVLRPGGLLLMEHGCAQGEAARSLCPPERWSSVQTGRDLAGRDRYLIAAHR